MPKKNIICKFFQNGRCKNGNNCDFIHPGVQNQSRPAFTSSTDSSQQLEDISRELPGHLTENRPIWILSSFSPISDVKKNLISGTDLSPEEDRWLYYKSVANNTQPQYFQEREAKIQHQRAVEQFILKDPRKAARYSQRCQEETPAMAFGPPQNSAPAWGNSGNSTFGQPAFGASTFGSNSNNTSDSNSTFGKSAFGQSNTSSAPSFGTTSFGAQNKSNASPFSSTSSNSGGFGSFASGGSTFSSFASGAAANGGNTFGSLSSTSNNGSGSGFGAASQSNNTSGFGQPSFGQPAFGQTAFGAKPANTPSSTSSGAFNSFKSSPFAKNPSSTLTNPFAGNAPSAIANPFGGAASSGAASSPNSTSGSLFDSNNSVSTLGKSPFGQQSSNTPAFGQNTDSKPSPFGAASNTNNTTSAFGQTPESKPLPFGGSSNTNNPSPFASLNESKNSSPFGATAANNKSAFGQTSTTDNQTPAPFGKITPSTGMPFGNSSNSSGSGFGFGNTTSNNTNSGSSFGFSSFGAAKDSPFNSTSSPFGQTAQQSNPFGNSTFGNNGGSSYQELKQGKEPEKAPEMKDLAQAVKDLFLADKFIPGKIPEVIPPIETR